MKKRIFATCFAALLVLASSMTAFAEDRQGESGWQVTFDGRRMESNFSTAKIDEQIGGLQPGDSIELTITLRNNYNGNVDWYMKNQVLESLEDAGNAAGGAYDYLLTYTDKAGETTTLYSSDYFGGDGRINGIGLHGATTTLDDYFYLDRMTNNDTGVVKLKVRLEGETQGNVYQNTLARLQMDFAVELPGATGNPGSGRESVKTGDQTKILLYVILTLVAGIVLLATAMIRLRRDREEVPAAAAEDTTGKTVRRRRK